MTRQRSHADLDAAVVAHARVLPLDVVRAKESGHGGTAVGLTPALYVLFQEYLRQDPADPRWEGRDRFVLSCGHASLALYVQLFLSGHGLDMEDLRRTRTLGSLTPGHPEFGHTPGVEVTTGPLGQGVANAVGMALAARRRVAMLDPDGEDEARLFATRTWCLASDGDLQEGISHEAASLAGTLRLDDLVVIWDDNRISIDGDTAITFGEDVVARHRAYGWEVLEVGDPEDLDQLRVAYARAGATSAPVLVRLRSRIGHPMPTVGGTAGAHSGDPGQEEVAATKRLLGLDPDRDFHLPQDLLDHARQVAERGRRTHVEWDRSRADWAATHPERDELATSLDDHAVSDAVVASLRDLRAAPREVATRKASAAVLDAVLADLPWLWGGSADLAGSNGVDVDGVGHLLPDGVTSPTWSAAPAGPLLHFGIREHAMAAIANGIAATDGGVPFVATFFVFSDYLRPAVRLSALMDLSVVYVFTHDSVAVGEDGPTHQPVEQLWSNRAIPGLDVVRPADWVETVEAWERVLTTPRTGPTALVLSRQATPVVSRPGSPGTGPEAGAGATTDAAGDTTGAAGREATRAGGRTARGGYVVAGEGDHHAVVIATGTEVAVAMQARERLRQEGVAVRVVSMPCVEWFDAQPAEYRNQVLPPSTRARVSVEAGTDTGWHRFVGLDGATVSVEEFGASGSGPEVLAARGIDVDAVVAAVRETMAATDGLTVAAVE